MIRGARWAHCIRHRGAEARDFFELFLGESHRQVLLIGGAGFDPRSVVMSELVGAAAAGRVRGLFFQEDRPNPVKDHARRAEENAVEITRLVRDIQLEPIRIFASGSMAITGGREAVRAVRNLDLSGATDIILDASALSIGIVFPIVRYLLAELDLGDGSVNLHLVVVDEPATDRAITAISSDSVETMAGFKGDLGLDHNFEAAKLWLPQLAHGVRTTLGSIHAFVRPDEVAPILPFPSTTPRVGDELTDDFGIEFESTWQVDARDIIHADEKLPLDLYRTILKIHEKRRRVFDGIGGSLVVLSPVGSKVLALGALLAAIERDLPVVYVEPIGFIVDLPALDTTRTMHGDLVHLWLRGEADPCQDLETTQRDQLCP